MDLNRVTQIQNGAKASAKETRELAKMVIEAVELVQKVKDNMEKLMEDCGSTGTGIG